jgi:flagellar hook-associated protein 1
MPSSFLGLETTLRGILAQQLALDTTSHNISNANTAGYTRQRANLATTDPFTVPGVNRAPEAGQLGTGVTVADYTRIRDGFIDIQLRAQTMRSGEFEATQDGLNQVELALREPSDNGLNTLLSQYWSSWQDVSNAPENMATRQALVQNAAALAQGMKDLSASLGTITSQTGQNVSMTIDDVNSTGRQVAILNDAISRATLMGDAPNDLLDQRDMLIDKLSKLGNTQITHGALGSVDITIGGAALVTGTSSASLVETDFTSLTSGKLKGLITLRDVTLPSYKSTLDTIASTLVTRTNAQHAAGYDLAGTAGGAFFTGTDASTIGVSAAIVGNPALVAASGNGAPGNAANALALAGLRTTPAIGSATIDTAYSQLVTRIGSDSQEATRNVDNAKVISEALEARRQSISGVSLDEEMVSLVKYQRGYQASARAMSAMDTMLDTLISRTGRVGL